MDDRQLYYRAHRPRRQSAPYRAYLLLRFAIKSGVIPTGAQLDERGIMAGLHSSRASVREALGALADEGLIQRRTNVGTTVTVEPIPISLDDIVPLNPAHKMTYRQTEKVLLPESPYLTGRLSDGSGPVIMTESILLVGELKIGVLTVFSHTTKDGMSLLSSVEEMHSLADEFPIQYGTEFGDIETSVDARIADESVAAKLEIEVGSPVLVREQVLRDRSGAVWEYGFAQYRTDYVVLRSTPRGRGPGGREGAQDGRPR